MTTVLTIRTAAYPGHGAMVCGQPETYRTMQSEATAIVAALTAAGLVSVIKLDEMPMEPSCQS